MTENFFGITDKGKRRDKNEDTFISQQIHGTQLQVACVIDGVGGYSGGEVAASIARTVILEHLKKLSGDVISILKQAIVSANEKIFTEKRKENGKESMACVLTVAVTDINNNKFYYAHVGDTRLYLLRDNSLVKISKDHSVVGFLEESGRLSEEEAMRHPRRNEINKALGFEPAISADTDFIETGESPFLPGDMLLLCSDGLSDMIGSETITPILVAKTTLSAKARQLVDAANHAGGNDNITAVLVENNRQSKIKTSAIPAQKKNESMDESVATVTPADRTINSKKSNTGLVAFLTLLSLALAFAFLFTLFKDKAQKEIVTTPQAIPVLTKSAAETTLLAGFNDSSKVFALGNAGNPISISDSVFITKDSFHLIGNGNTLRSDSNYHGAGLVLTSSAKQILLDSLVFENFDVAIITNTNNLLLRNVRFINCRVPIQYNIAFTDTVVTGQFVDSFFSSRSPVN